mgnify:CR=1 FL=1
MSVIGPTQHATTQDDRDGSTPAPDEARTVPCPAGELENSYLYSNYCYGNREFHMNKYVALWAWTREAFGKKPFTIEDFRGTFPSPDPAKVLHDMARLNLIHRVEKAKYSLVQPTDLAKSIVEESMARERILEQAPHPFAFSHDDAVTIWTDGYYWTGFTPGFKPVHIQVNKADRKEWKKFLSEHQAEYALEGERKTMFGLVFILHPVGTVSKVIKNDTPVVPLETVLEYCRERIHFYKPALDYLQEKYGPATGEAPGNAS